MIQETQSQNWSSCVLTIIPIWKRVRTFLCNIEPQYWQTNGIECAEYQTITFVFAGDLDLETLVQEGTIRGGQAELGMRRRKIVSKGKEILQCKVLTFCPWLWNFKFCKGLKVWSLKLEILYDFPLFIVTNDYDSYF